MERSPLSSLQPFMLEELGQLNCGLSPAPLLPLSLRPFLPIKWRQDGEEGKKEREPSQPGGLV